MDGESDSIMSSASENSTEPWFCDACKNGVAPSCELCPNQDGIFKETDAGRWAFMRGGAYAISRSHSPLGRRGGRINRGEREEMMGGREEIEEKE